VQDKGNLCLQLLLVTFIVATESVEARKAVNRPVWAGCANKPKCLLFDIFSGFEKPGRFGSVEAWNQIREFQERSTYKTILSATVGEDQAVLD
jgi:hypothetical protein